MNKGNYYPAQFIWRAPYKTSPQVTENLVLF